MMIQAVAAKIVACFLAMSVNVSGGVQNTVDQPNDGVVISYSQKADTSKSNDSHNERHYIDDEYQSNLEYNTKTNH